MAFINRDSLFWQSVADHPEVRPSLLGHAFDASMVLHEAVMPVASQNGGYIFVRLDWLGRVWELHSLFKPDGWGREAFGTAQAALSMLPGWQMVTTYQTADRKSQPPKSFGFKPAGQFEDTEFGPIRTWFLTRDAYEASPSFNRRKA